MGAMTNGSVQKTHHRFCRELQEKFPTVKAAEWVCDCPPVEKSPIAVQSEVIPPNDYKLIGIVTVSASADIVIAEKEGSWAVWTRHKQAGTYSNGSYFALAHRDLMGEPSARAKREFCARLGL